MSESIGRIIDTDTDSAAGKPVTQQTDGRVIDGEIRPFEPQILYGRDESDFTDPVTERIGTGASGSGGSEGTRRTKSGRIDRRTRAGRGGSTDTGTGAEAPSTPGVVGIEKVNLTDILYDIHASLAFFLSTPELELDKEEAKKYGEFIKRGAAYTSVALDPKKVFIFEFVFFLCALYGMRFVTWRNRKKAELEEAPKAGPSLVQQRPAPAAPSRPSKPLHETSPSELWAEGGGLEGSIPI
jgi:hypothetical protein